MRFGPSNANGVDKGFILIFAVAACLLLAAIGLIVSRSVQSALRGAHTAVDVAKAGALADAGVALAVVRIQADLTVEPFVCTLGEAGLVAVSIADEAGKVSLNTGNSQLLSALFVGLGASRDEARDHVARIFDYRDPDDVAATGGAEREAYVAAGRTGGPKNADFDTVPELDRVLGLSPRILSLAKPHLTTASTAGGVDAAAASDALLQILASGEGLNGAVAAFGDRPGLPAAFATQSTRTFYKIRSVGVADGARYLRETVIARPVRPGESLRHLSWIQGELDASDETLLARATPAPPC